MTSDSDKVTSVRPLPTAVGKDPLFDQFGVTVPEPRHDILPNSLERRGVTSHFETPTKSRKLDGQLEFWERLSLYAESIVAKLDQAGFSGIADGIRSCHTEVSYRRCRGCSTVSKFYNRCELKWCPLCAPRLARERQESIRAWVGTLKHPKHVVLTCRNSETLTKERVRAFKASFSKLRRSKFASGWRGGFYSLEVTNEQRGWHLHLHALVDADWIDQAELAREWARCVGQDFAVVYVSGKQDVDYVREVAKYLVKGSVLAKWSGEELAAFITAFNGVRCFQPFGNLLGERTRVRELIRALLDVKPLCECGCSDFQIMSPNELEEFQLHRKVTFRKFPPRCIVSGTASLSHS